MFNDVLESYAAERAENLQQIRTLETRQAQLREGQLLLNHVDQIDKLKAEVSEGTSKVLKKAVETLRIKVQGEVKLANQGIDAVETLKDAERLGASYR